MKNYLLFLCLLIFTISTKGQVVNNENSYKGLDTNNIEVISIHPNPLTNKSSIRLSNNKDGVTILIYNVLGKKMKTIQSKSNTIILKREDLNSGVYILQITSSKGVTIHSQKLIVK